MEGGYFTGVKKSDSNRCPFIAGMQIDMIGQKLNMMVMNEEIAVAAPPDISQADVADMLQNDISQTLAAILLWIQSAREEKNIAGNQHLQLAEQHLKATIQQLVLLHYTLVDPMPSNNILTRHTAACYS